MSENKPSKSSAGNIATGIAMAASVLPLVKPAIETVKEYSDKIIEDRKKLVSVPELYSKEYPLSIEQAAEILESCGLKMTTIKTSISDADIKFRNCFDLQVLKTKPKAKQKVERGSRVLVKYITQEVIDESQRMFELSEKHKRELSLEKSIRQAKQKEKTKRVIAGAVDAAKQGVKKIPTVFRENSEKENHNE